MVKNTNKRIMITLSKQQAQWLENNAKKLNISVSKFIKFLMDKNITKFANMLTEREWEYLRKIARTPWINCDNDDDDTEW